MAGSRPYVQTETFVTDKPAAEPRVRQAPPNLSKSPPIPQPGPPVEEVETLSPTRYGDWEKGGIAIDF